MNNYKTTITGVLTIVVAVLSATLSFLQGEHVDVVTTTTAVMAGVGLISARDAKPTDLTPTQATAVKQTLLQ